MTNPSPRRSWITRINDGILKIGGAFVFGAGFVFTVIIVFMCWEKWYDLYQALEAAVVALVGVFATYNFGSVGNKIANVLTELAGDRGGISASDFANELYMTANIIAFSLALGLLALKHSPDLYILGIFLVFLMFASSNLRQAEVLNVLLAQHAGCSNLPRQTGALLMDVAKWLASENGPSMGCYSVLAVLAAFSIHNKAEESFALFSAGAATFHLFVSVLNFLSGNKNPLDHALTHITWGETDSHGVTVLYEITNVTGTFVKTWKRWRIGSVIIAAFALVISRVPSNGWSWLGGLIH
jgi:hypothetical protein